MSDRSGKIDDFLNASGWLDATRTCVAGDASNRRYDRLHRPNGDTAILMDAPPIVGEDVLPFILISDHLRQAGLSAPQIYARDVRLGLLIIEDFGDALFADLMTANPERQIPLYRAATNVLIHLHDTQSTDLQLCDSAWLLEMIAPLFEWYVPDTNIKDIRHLNSLLQPHFDAIAASENVTILRDFHAQNLLLLSHRTGVASVGVLDFQDAMLGHPAYDLVSILQDARRDVSAEIETEILNYMLDQTEHDPVSYRKAYAVLGVQRNLRIIGIFARLCLRDGKAQYVDFIPRVWRYIERNLTHPDLAELSTHLRSILPIPTTEFLEHLKHQCPTQNSLP